MVYKSGGFKLSLKHRPSHHYLDMRQECRTSKRVVSRSCDWLLLVLAMRARRAPLNKNQWEDRQVVIKAFGDGSKTIQHLLLGK